MPFASVDNVAHDMAPDLPRKDPDVAPVPAFIGPAQVGQKQLVHQYVAAPIANEGLRVQHAVGRTGFEIGPGQAGTLLDGVQRRGSRLGVLEGRAGVARGRDQHGYPCKGQPDSHDAGRLVPNDSEPIVTIRDRITLLSLWSRVAVPCPVPPGRSRHETSRHGARSRTGAAPGGPGGTGRQGKKGRPERL